jgi:hypothetical protein
MQTYLFYTRFRDEIWTLKLLVRVATVVALKSNVPFFHFRLRSSGMHSHSRLISHRNSPFFRSCEAAHVICIGHALYVMTISDYGHPELFARPPDSFIMTIILSGILAVCGSFYRSYPILLLT